MDTNLADMPDASASTVLTIGCDDALARSALAPVLPSAEVRSIGTEFLSRLPVATALIVADAAHAQIARAAGFTGGIVVNAAPVDAAERAAFLAQGTHFADPTHPRALTEALAAAIQRSPDGAPEAVPADVARTRRLLAAGALALKLQHTLSNPLTALLAEVQMLQMDAPNDEIKATAARMLALVRRLAEISRSLDAVRDHRPAGR